MKCSQCGADLYEGASFCGECGARVGGEDAAPASRPDSKPRSRATVNAQRRQRQTAPRYSEDQSVTGTLSGAAGLKVVDEAKKNGPVDLELNEDGTMAAETGRSPRKQREDQCRQQRQEDEALRMASQESSVERTTGQAKDAPAQVNEDSGIAFKTTSAAAATAGAATAGAAADASATADFAAAPPASPAVPSSGATQPINVAAEDWDDALTTIINPVQVEASTGAADNQQPGQPYGQAPYYEAEAPAPGSMRPVVEHPDRVSGMYEAQQKKKRRRGIAAALIGVALLAGAGGAWFASQQAASEAETQAIVQANEAKSQQAKEEAAAAQEQQKVEDHSSAVHNVRLSVSGINYDEAGTRIPVQLMGATEAGESINKVAFVGSDGKGISVPAGTYSATVLASPIASTGMLYTVPTDRMDFTITQDMAQEVSTGQAIVLMPIEAADITKDMVDYAYSLAVQDTANAARAETCKAAADKVVAANDTKTKEEEEKAEKERMRQARPQLAQEFVSNYFTNVMFTNSNDDSEVLLIDNWSSVVVPYAKQGTGLANSLSGETSGDYYAARNVTVSSQDDTSVTVKVNVASAKEIAPGWTAQGWDATVKCIFDDDNLITAMEITTPKGTTKY